MSEVNKETLDEIVTSMHGDGCRAKSILDQMDFKDAIETLKMISKEPDSNIGLSYGGGPKTLYAGNLPWYLRVEAHDSTRDGIIFNHSVYERKFAIYDDRVEETSSAPDCNRK